jgi:hypothetical protein
MMRGPWVPLGELMLRETATGGEQLANEKQTWPQEWIRLMLDEKRQIARNVL